MDFLAKARRVFEIEIAALQHQQERLGDDFARAVEAISAVRARGGKVVVIGVGKSGHIGEKIAATLTSTGTPAVVLNPLNALHGDIGVVADGDVVLALSASGATQELLAIFQPLRRVNAKIISLTRADSELARESDLVIAVDAQEACPLGLAPTSSTTTMLVLGDALAMVLLEAHGFTAEDFANFHPGGRIGAMLQRADQIMRGPDRLPVVTLSMRVRDVLAEMTRRRAGLAVGVDGAGRLAGVFSHSDFAREYQRDPLVGDRAVGDIITHNPKAVLGSRLAVDVLCLIREYHIDDVVVVDADGRPVGVVDSQDLAAQGLV